MHIAMLTKCHLLQIDIVFLMFNVNIKNFSPCAVMSCKTFYGVMVRISACIPNLVKFYMSTVFIFLYNTSFFLYFHNHC